MNMNKSTMKNVSMIQSFSATSTKNHPIPFISCTASPIILPPFILRQTSSDRILDKKLSKRKSYPKRSIDQVVDSDERFLKGIVVLDVYSVYLNNPKDLLPVVRKKFTKKKIRLTHNSCNGSNMLPRPSGQFDFSEFQNTKGAPDVVWKKGGNLNISPEMEMYDLLTPEELKISSILRVLPAQYLHIKETILTQVVRRGPFKKRDAKTWFRIDVNKIAILFDWFKALGWIPPDDNWEKKKEEAS